MNAAPQIPAGRIWLPVHDLPSALAALRLLSALCPDPAAAPPPSSAGMDTV